jgi:hypothetical protein
MGSKSLREAPLWAAKYQIGPPVLMLCAHNIGKMQILHPQGFDVHISDLLI